MNVPLRFLSFVLCALLAPAWLNAEEPPFQYYKSFMNGSRSYDARLWLPPESESIRGLIICNYTSNEITFTTHPAIRQVAAEKDLGILLIYPGYAGLFQYATTDVEVILEQLLADLAEISGFPEIEHCPWVTFGHSTSGIFARNVAYWKPDRMICIFHSKSGNFSEHIQEEGALFPVVPMLAINGQFEEYGPTGQNPSDGVTSWEIQWLEVRNSLLEFRTLGRPVSLLVEPGAGHMALSDIVVDYAALYLAKAVDYRVPEGLVARNGPITLNPYNEADGWLTEAVPEGTLTHSSAPYDSYTGPKDEAFWHFDQELAQAWEDFHLGKLGEADQLIRFTDASGAHAFETMSIPASFEPDGLTFSVNADYLTAYPSTHPQSGEAIGSSGNPILYRVMRGPAEQIGPSTFRMKPNNLGVTLSNSNPDVRILAYVPAGDGYRYAERMLRSRIRRTTSGTQETITFSPVPDREWDAAPVALNATAVSGNPVDFYVAYGPGKIVDGELVLTDVPANGRFPIDMKIRAAIWKVSSTGRINSNDEQEWDIQVLAPPLEMGSASMDGEALQIRWQGGAAPFTVEKATSLSLGDWTNIQETNVRDVSVPTTGDDSAFFRIQDTNTP